MCYIYFGHLYMHLKVQNAPTILPTIVQREALRSHCVFPSK